MLTRPVEESARWDPAVEGDPRIMRSPKRYASIEDFEREEIRADMKVGWSLDDLYADANQERRADDFDSPRELEFGE